MPAVWWVTSVTLSSSGSSFQLRKGMHKDWIMLSSDQVGLKMQTPSNANGWVLTEFSSLGLQAHSGFVFFSLTTSMFESLRPLRCLSATYPTHQDSCGFLFSIHVNLLLDLSFGTGTLPCLHSMQPLALPTGIFHCCIIQTNASSSCWVVKLYWKEVSDWSTQSPPCPIAVYQY